MSRSDETPAFRDLRARIACITPQADAHRITVAIEALMVERLDRIATKLAALMPKPVVEITPNQNEVRPNETSKVFPHLASSIDAPKPPNPTDEALEDLRIDITHMQAERVLVQRLGITHWLARDIIKHVAPILKRE